MTDKPVAVVLLDERVVIDRLANGALAAACDISYHRGVPLVPIHRSLTAMGGA